MANFTNKRTLFIEELGETNTTIQLVINKSMLNKSEINFNKAGGVDDPGKGPEAYFPLELSRNYSINGKE